MFKAQREQVLQRSVFQPFAVNTLDAWTDGQGECSVEYKSDSISPSRIPHWLEYRGDFSGRCPNFEAGTKGAGFIRLLLCETPHWHPLTFAMSQDQFLAVESAFDLPTATLPLFESHGSLHTWSVSKDRFYFVMKVQQQNPIANYGLSFCHDLITKTTTGILYGLNLTWQQEWYGTGYSGASRMDELLPQLMKLGSLLDNPLLLPILLLGCDIRRTQQFCMSEIEPRLLQVEEVLRVTRPGQITGKIDILLREKHGEDGDYTPLPFDEDRPYYQRKPKMIKLMAEINTLTTENLIALSVPSWQIRFAGFLKTFLEEPSKMSTSQYQLPHSEEMDDMMNHFASAAANNMDHIQQLKSRMELQLQVLYQFMTQTDNHLHATLAAAATRDSTAMKTLAFLTALFLPGTYVATLFSMDMFNWSGPKDTGGDTDVAMTTTVSSSFWIYWIVTGILTFAVIGGWRIWWKKENRRHTEQYKTFLGLLDKKHDERPMKDDCTTDGYHAAREESEDDDGEENDCRGRAKLRGGAGSNPVNWLVRAGHALGLENVGLRSNRGNTDAGTEAGPLDAQSNLAVDVEAGLERPDEINIDHEPEHELQPELELQETIPPRSRRRYSRSLSSRHRYPYYLKRGPELSATSRAVSCTEPVLEDTGVGVEAPVLLSPALPPLSPRSDPPEDPWTWCIDYSNFNTKPSEVPEAEEFKALAEPRLAAEQHEVRGSPCPSTTTSLMCGNSPGHVQQFPEDQTKIANAANRKFMTSKHGPNDGESTELMDEVPLGAMKLRMRCGFKDNLEPGQLECIRQAAMLGGRREGETQQQLFRDQLEAQLKEQESFPPPDAIPSSQYFTDFLAWLENPCAKARMGVEAWEFAKRSAQRGDWQGLENLHSFLQWCDYEKTRQIASYRLQRMLQLHSASKMICKKIKRNCSQRNQGATQPSIERETQAEVAGSHSSNSLSLPLTTEPQTVDSTVPQGPTSFYGWHSNPGPPGELSALQDPSFVLPSRSFAASFPPAPPFRIPGRGNNPRDASSGHDNDVDGKLHFCSSRFPTYQEPCRNDGDNNANDGRPKGKEKREQNQREGEAQPASGEEQQHHSDAAFQQQSGNHDGILDGSPVMPMPAPTPAPQLVDPAPSEVQRRRDRLATHPPVVRHLAEMRRQALRRGWTAAQIGRLREWHLVRLAKQWWRVQQRQFVRQGSGVVIAATAVEHMPADLSDGGGGVVVVDGRGGPHSAAQHHHHHPLLALTPLPPIRIRGLDFDISTSSPATEQHREDAAKHEKGDEQDQEQEQEQDRIRIATQQQMQTLKVVAREEEEDGPSHHAQQQQEQGAASPSHSPPNKTAGVGASHHEHENPRVTDAAVHNNDSTITGAPFPVASSSRYSQSTVAGNGGSSRCSQSYLSLAVANADDDVVCADADTPADTGSESDSWSRGGEDAA